MSIQPNDPFLGTWWHSSRVSDPGFNLSNFLYKLDVFPRTVAVEFVSTFRDNAMKKEQARWDALAKQRLKLHSAERRRQEQANWSAKGKYKASMKGKSYK